MFYIKSDIILANMLQSLCTQAYFLHCKVMKRTSESLCPLQMPSRTMGYTVKLSNCKIQFTALEQETVLSASAVRGSACTLLRLPCVTGHDDSKYRTPVSQESQGLNKVLQGSVTPSDRRTQA